MNERCNTPYILRPNSPQCYSLTRRPVFLIPINGIPLSGIPLSLKGKDLTNLEYLLSSLLIGLFIHRRAVEVLVVDSIYAYLHVEVSLLK